MAVYDLPISEIGKGANENYLVIDAGNLYTKVAVFGPDFFFQIFEDWLKVADLKDIVANRKIKTAILASSRGDIPEKLRKYLKKNFDLLQSGKGLKLPIKSNYKKGSPGFDRLAASAYAKKMFPGKKTLVIVAGTCITYNVLNAQGEFCGGAISPGLWMRAKAMHAFTNGLPMVEPDYSKKLKVRGESTDENLAAGVGYGAISEIEGMIAKYKLDSGIEQVLISGGDGKFLAASIKCNIFVSPIEQMVLKGLYLILKHNV